MVNVYDGYNIIAKVKYNSLLDIRDGGNYYNGGLGHHLGITKLRKLDKYVLIHGSDWQGERPYAEVVSDYRALQEILKADKEELLDEPKFSRLKDLSEKILDEEDEIF